MNAVFEQRRLPWRAQVSVRLREVLDDPNPRDLPNKIQTDRVGQSIMSQAKNISTIALDPPYA